MSREAIALNRFGLGARVEDEVDVDPARYLKAQFERYEVAPIFGAALPDARMVIHEYEESRRARRMGDSPQFAKHLNNIEAPQSKARQSEFIKEANDIYRREVQIRARIAVVSEAPFVERLVHFWANHFCIAAGSPNLNALAGSFEREAIRPHVLGRFEDLLLAAERHPAMLIYLNQKQSIGPNSILGRQTAQLKRKTRGLNENFAREIMELHTLGVRSDYTQGDVTELAKALTGWTVGGPDAPIKLANDRAHTFWFRTKAHEPGERVIRGRAYSDQGELQAASVLADLAQSPHTARHIAMKLARHFTADTPPATLVDRLATSFIKSRGNLRTVYESLIDSPEAWSAAPSKFKSPWEWQISMLRGLGPEFLNDTNVLRAQLLLNQPVWKPRSPAGWADTAVAWASSDALLRRVDMAQAKAAQAAATHDARLLAPKILPGSLRAKTAELIAMSGSPALALALLFISPEFLRR